jgi:hypothetical protein
MSTPHDSRPVALITGGTSGIGFVSPAAGFITGACIPIDGGMSVSM